MNGSPVPDRPVALDDADALDGFVGTHDLALVEFYTDGCGICESMEPVVGAVALTTDAAVGYVNPRDDPVLIERFTITSVPAFVRFEHGEPVAEIADGFLQVDELTAFVERGT